MTQQPPIVGPKAREPGSRPDDSQSSPPFASTSLRKGYKALLAEAQAQVRTLDLAQARALHDSGEALFVDLRDPREREREGCIPGAFHCPRGMLEFWLDPESPYAKPQLTAGSPLAFFCAGGWRSALAAKTAQDMGLADVAHIEGGFAAWRAAGHPVDTAAPSA